MGNDIGRTGPRATGGGDGEPAHPVNHPPETPAHAPTHRANNGALAKLLGPVRGIGGAMRGLRVSATKEEARAAALRAKTLDRARQSWGAATMDDGSYAQILDSIARSITFDGLFDEPPPLGEVPGGARKGAVEHPAHRAVDPSNVEELRTIFSDMLALSSHLPAHSQRHWLAALVRIAGMLPPSQGEQSEQRQALSAARQAWDGRKLRAAHYAEILSMLGRGDGSSNPKVDPGLLADISIESLKLPVPVREALARSLEQAAITPEQE
ncbi:hypothetical protein GWC77_14300 [Paraburkholderia sp. NMBU_R16]|uniref:hypothetical protein n=1 Tax=Paraburkholderia sp. NMBU_R16 TaxID=2698676 RepID=UPI0015636012|nr:hypothetical protein [Paraburkholderia sp. NMBU_R16]NRO97094.1 hypothetical protein [Paraburkholderia sp. NMBU_R16]